MHTINIDTISPLAVTAISRADDCARIDGLTANEWLTGYWRSQIRAVLPQFHGDEPAQALSCLADALADEDVIDAAGFVTDYREFTDRPTNDETLSRMIVSALLDWSKWTGAPSVDDARAQDWLRSLLA